MPVCLDDTKPDERMIGTGAALALLERCDAVMIGKRYGISEGMAAEITKATDIGNDVSEALRGRIYRKLKDSLWGFDFMNARSRFSRRFNTRNSLPSV